MPKVPNGLREWIVQRCTQRWIETELQYEDWPAIQCPVTQTEMLEKVKYWSREYPDDEFRSALFVSEGVDRTS
jgi:hypothetical protein